jgi:phosphomannomutase
MTLIKSISGIRGTIGGVPGEGLSPLDVVKYTAAYAAWIKASAQSDAVKAGKSSPVRYRIVVGRDARISGPMVNSLVVATLVGMGCDVTDIGMATTPTTELAVTAEKASGGIILTASHNPKQWNALKLLNHKGEFLSAADGQVILELAEAARFVFAGVDDLGVVSYRDYLEYHIGQVLNLELVDRDAIRAAGFRVAVDAVNSVGGIAIPALLKALGIQEVVEINCNPDGIFAHNPEPLAEHLADTCRIIQDSGVDIGFVTDPDVDRLAIINEDGSLFNEEYTLVAVADYVLGRTPGNTVSNLSSSRALQDITLRHGGLYQAAAVGEVNVVEKMKATAAIIGGEGNGGIIYPASHYGRDALVGVALFLSHLARTGLKTSALRERYPAYYMSKNKIELTPGTDVDGILVAVRNQFPHEKVTDIDGVKIDFEDSWVHLRKSNTEPIIRIYTEAKTSEAADQLAQKFLASISEIENV